ncbi:hypothetical protein B0H10DRAFT_1824555 [Mycena sp. CBHHK59/15]|nr:hypothetical protein B0H10DRAFT_1824555 [Mycena sp. CBHHK59/15]
MITAIVGAGGIALHSAQVPTTPKRQPGPAAITNSPVLPTPTKLPRFLEHAERSLGVVQARTFESPMRRNGYGPDIMHLLDNKALEDIGMNKGDVLRIKTGAPQWWNGPDAKRKRVDSNNSGGSAAVVAKVSFEVRYADGGAQRLYGPRITPAQSPSQSDNDTWYRCPVRNAWVPMPLGYRPVFDNGEEAATEDGDDLDHDEAAATLFSMHSTGH